MVPIEPDVQRVESTYAGALFKIVVYQTRRGFINGNKQGETDTSLLVAQIEVYLVS